MKIFNGEESQYNNSPIIEGMKQSSTLNMRGHDITDEVLGSNHSAALTDNADDDVAVQTEYEAPLTDSNVYASSKVNAAESVFAEVNSGESNQPEFAWSDGNVSVATSSVNDEMSFSEAFAAARAEVGPGGAFEWRGGVYGTYTADEWANMSSAERTDYSSHFDWSKIGQSQSDVSSSDPAHTDTHDIPAHVDVAGGTDITDEVLVSGVEPTADIAPVAEENIEVLGVDYDPDTDMTIAGMSVDGQEVAFVDINNDGLFDVAVADFDGDGQISLNEMEDISTAGISVDDINSFGNDLIADAGTPDYIDDANIYDI
ncbi:MAG: hypothetical protein NC402_08370 [Prevotella sp.]|nr:hypothetical protein [Prevotella sp.]MCM1074152.1 hypothetical protein [Ruminococcus sp.]